MQVRFDLEIRGKLADYLSNQIPLDEFKEWFIPATWHIEESGNGFACDLANEIHLRLAEFSNGHWTENELRRVLSPLIESYAVSISFGSQAATTNLPFCSTASATFRQQVVGREFSVASE